MFAGFTDDTVRFLMDLRFHNYTDFFHDQHDRYVRDVQTPFYELIEDLAPTMLSIDPMMEIRPWKCLSRIHRDTRFSKDKSPYRDHHWFLFRRAGEPREKSLFYFVEFGPERLDWGMGLWGENREVMDGFRKRIVANPDGISAMIENMNLPGRKLGLGGTIFRRIDIPTGIPPKLERWYRSKEMYVGKVSPDYRLAFSERLTQEIRKDFTALSPLYQLLRGICDDQESFIVHQNDREREG